MPLPNNALEQAHDRIRQLKAALAPFAAHVHSDGVDAPYPEDYWRPLFEHAKAAIMVDDKSLAISDLLAYGREQASYYLAQRDRDQYQFWKGWCAALDRVAPKVWQSDGEPTSTNAVDPNAQPSGKPSPRDE